MVRNFEQIVPDSCNTLQELTAIRYNLFVALVNSIYCRDFYIAGNPGDFYE